VYGLVSTKHMKSAFLIIVGSSRLGMGPRTALSIDRDFDPAEIVNVLISTLVRLYCARTPLLRSVLCADKIVGLGCSRRTSK